ncbi:MAG: tetratricopeptide repeat protein [Phycisphaerae bacterium]
MGRTADLLRTDRWERAKEIFDELAELPPAERRARLSRLCGNDPSLRDAIESLLSAHEQVGGFLDQPSVDTAALAELFDARQARAAHAVGQRVGRYTLLELLGEGGFGVVYLAQQEEPVRRQVALKVVKPGMDSRHVIARFEAERQALALMDHPSIARVFDGGQTDSGHPYFVMELVRGLPVTRFADEHRLSVPERVKLFAAVCRAVHHAHQKGVIHRDLKPGNVLVVEQDGRPVPKVIDFGVAKAIGGAADSVLAHTAARQLIGTPAYMSPEQLARGEDVDTRSDVYSLGVLLYELLSGTTPFDKEALERRGVGDIERAIREAEPQRPSTRIAQAARTAARRPVEPPVEPRSDAAARATCPAPDVAANRATDPASLARLLRGELDWIVMKCLEKDRARRYDSASSIADDLERFVRGEAVQAGPPSALYRARKFAGRHRAALLAAGAVSAALVLGLGAAISGFVAAQAARGVAEHHRRLAESRAEQARQAAAKAEAVARFLQEMLASADPRESAQRDISMREVLDKAVARLDAGSLSAEPDSEAAARLVIGRTLRELARYEPAAVQIEQALALYERLRGEDHLDYADALQERATLRKNCGDSAGSADDFCRALEINRRHRPPDDPRMIAILNDSAAALTDSNRVDLAEAQLREALALARRPAPGASPYLSEVLNNLAFALAAQQRYDEAEPLFREAIEVNRRALGDVHPNLATNLDNLAQLLVARGALEQAAESYRDALAIRRTVFGDDHPDVAVTLHNYAVLLHRQGDVVGCEAAVRESFDIFRRIHGLANLETLQVLDSLVSVVGAQARLDEAERLLTEAIDAVRDSAGIPASRKAALARRLAELYTAWSKPADAEHWRAVEAEFSRDGSEGGPR